MALAPVREAASWASRFGAAHIVIILVWLGRGAGLQLAMGLRAAHAQEGRCTDQQQGRSTLGAHGFRFVLGWLKVGVQCFSAPWDSPVIRRVIGLGFLLSLEHGRGCK